LNHGLMEQDTREITLTGRKKAKELFTLQMDQYSEEILKEMRLMGLVFTNGLMVKSMKVNGLITKCVVEEH